MLGGGGLYGGYVDDGDDDDDDDSERDYNNDGYGEEEADEAARSDEQYETGAYEQGSEGSRTARSLGRVRERIRMQSNSPALASSQSPPVDIYASIAHARGAAAAGRSVFRNTVVSSLVYATLVTSRAPPNPFQAGSHTPLIATPYTDDERVPCRRSGKSLVVSAPRFPTLSQLHTWGTTVGHGLTAVSSYSVQVEYGWFLQLKRTSFGELD